MFRGCHDLHRTHVVLCKSLADIPSLGRNVQDNNGALTTTDRAIGMNQVCVWRDFGFWTEWALFMLICMNGCNFSVRQFLVESRKLY